MIRIMVPLTGLESLYQNLPAKLRNLATRLSSYRYIIVLHVTTVVQVPIIFEFPCT